MKFKTRPVTTKEEFEAIKGQGVQVNPFLGESVTLKLTYDQATEIREALFSKALAIRQGKYRPEIKKGKDAAWIEDLESLWIEDLESLMDMIDGLMS